MKSNVYLITNITEKGPECKTLSHLAKNWVHELCIVYIDCIYNVVFVPYYD
jgi:hypothetical protein